MNRAVADASAVLAFAFREAGWETAAPLLRAALISAVNAAEVTSRYMVEGGSSAATRAVLDDLYLEISPFDAEQAYLTGELHRQTRAYGLSLGDCACLALARSQGLPVVTADRAWRALPLDLEIVLIR